MKNKLKLLLFLLPFLAQGQLDTMVIRNVAKTDYIIQTFHEITGGSKKVREDNNSDVSANTLLSYQEIMASLGDSLNNLNEVMYEVDKKYLIEKYGKPVNSKVDAADVYLDWSTNHYLRKSVLKNGSVQVYFDFGKQTTDFAAHRSIEMLVNSWSKNPKAIIVIKGYSDTIGTIPYNQNLSLARAVETKNFLVKRFKVPASMISVIGLGENSVDHIRDESVDFLNRRVIIRIE